MAKKKPVSNMLLPYSFIGFGLLFFAIGAAVAVNSAMIFLRSTQVQGWVVDVAEGRGSDHDLRSEIVEFPYRGELYRVMEGTASNLDVTIGKPRTVLVPADHPEDAVLGSFGDRWVFPLAFGGFGLLFGGIGFFIRSRAARRSRVRERILAVGTRIQGREVGVEYDRSINFNGKSPWYLTAQFTVQGITFEAEGRRWWGPLERPETVEVAYNPTDPTENAIDD